MRKSVCYLLGGLLVGCASTSVLSPHGTLVLKPAITSGQYESKTVISPYTRSDIHHLILKLYTYDGSEHDQGIQRTLSNAQLDNPIVFSNLKPNTTYRIKTYAYLDASGSVLISVDASPSYTDVFLTSDDRPNVATLSVQLIDRLFNGQGTSSLSLISGGYSPVASESLTSALVGLVTTFAGKSTAGGTDAIRTGATFTGPRMLLVSSNGNIYVAETGGHRIRKIDGNGIVTTFAGSGNSGTVDAQGTSASFNCPYGIVMDASGNLYVSDYATNKIRKIDSAGNVTTFAGSGSAGSADGVGTSASFSLPHGLAIDSNQNLYVIEHGNNKIRKITPAQVVTTFAGSGATGFADGTGSAAMFNVPHGGVVDAQGNLYVSDYNNQRIRKVTPTGVVTTFAGNAASGSVDAVGTQASFYNPSGVTFDASGNLYVSDVGGSLIRKITPAGVVTTVAGNGTATTVDGTGKQASFYQPEGLAFDANGSLYVGTWQGTQIRRIQ